MLNPKLENFAKTNLVLSWNDAERNAIKTSIETVCQRAKQFFNSAEFQGVQIFGSWSRNTILPRKYDPESDIDLMFVFDRETHSGMNSESVRAKVKRFADKYYQFSQVRFDSPCVKLEMGHIKFDLVPAIQSAWLNGFEIPDGTGKWMSTDPKCLNERLVELNVSMGGNLVRNVVRLVKYWNKAKERSKMSSYEIESFVLNNIQWTPMTWMRERNTYDCFLYVMGEIAQQPEFCYGTTSSIVSNIKDARNNEDYSKQQLWLSHLLPEL